MTGLLHIAQQEQCIDLSRVAVHGWSYGKSKEHLYYFDACVWGLYY